MPPGSPETSDGASHFEVPALFTLPAFDGADGRDALPGVTGVQTGGRLTLKVTYLDAPDLRLVRAHANLSHRSGGASRPTWHLTVPALHGPVELSVSGPLTAVPPAMSRLLTAWLRGAEPEPVAVLRAERHALLLLGEGGVPLAEVVDDTLSVLDGRRVVARSRELVLLRDGVDLIGDDGLLHAVVARLGEAGATPVTAPAPAVVRALGSRAQAPADVPDVTPLSPSSPATDVVAHALRTSTSRLLLSDTAVRHGLTDGVHQLRVACRRMRSDLHTFAPLVDHDWSERLRVELKWLADSLGAARDLEVQRERLARSAGSDPLAPLDPAALVRLDTLVSRLEDQAQSVALAALDSPRYLSLLELLVDAARSPKTTPAADAPAREALPPLVLGAWERLAKAVGRLHPDDPDEVWHEARIRAKRARYAAEAVMTALGKRVAATAKVASAVQEVLGEHQDAATAASVLTDLAAEHLDDGPFCLALGRLIERQREEVRACRAELARLWRDVKPGKVVAWARG
jgi:CHAD domain-containing protein